VTANVIIIKAEAKIYVKAQADPYEYVLSLSALYSTLTTDMSVQAIAHIEIAILSILLLFFSIIGIRETAYTNPKYDITTRDIR
jgi:hypothetical protein